MSGYKKLPVTSGSTGDVTAIDVTFDNSGTGLSSTNVQDVIVELYNNPPSQEKYVRSFNNTTDWELQDDSYELSILLSTHNKGSSPNCKVYELINLVYHEIMTSVLMDEIGNVTIQVTSNPDNRFSGKITIE